MKWKPLLIIVSGILALALILYYRIHPLAPTLIIRGTTFVVDIAVTSSEIEKGLGGRKTLPPHHGMLFIRDHKDLYPFWMGGMEFPLDFIWIDGNEVVDITKNVPIFTDGKYTTLAPYRQVDKILEINAGEADAIGIQIGDIILFDR